MSTELAPTVGIKPMAAIYLRVSTKDQAGRGGEAEGFSIPAQREACLRKAESLGAVVVAEFVDAGESARSANRPELQKMLAFIKEHRLGYVIVHKVDRLARNRVDDVEINLQLKAAGAQLVSCSESIDETPSGMLMHGIMSSIAEFYSRNLANESKKGARQKAKNGGTPSMAPFGYLNTRERTAEGREVKTVSLDPDRAHWVTWIFEQYASGRWTVSQIRDHLIAAGVTTVQRPGRPSRPIAFSHVDNILKNRYYVGVVRYEGVEYPGKHQALVSEELFAAADRVRKHRRQSGEKPRVHNHYLKGTVYCGNCGEPLTFEQTRNARGNLYDYFYCLGRQGHRNGCQFRAIQAQHLEELVERHWATITRGATAVEQIRTIVTEHIEKAFADNEGKAASARSALGELDRRSQKLLQAHYADAISINDLKREQATIAASRAEIEAEMSKASVSEDKITKALDYCCSLLADAQQHYLQANEQQRRDLNQSTFEHVYISDDEVVGSDLRPVFQRLLSDSLSTELASERSGDQTRNVRTSDLYVVPDVGESAHRGELALGADLPSRARRPSPWERLGANLRLERPWGALPWERKNPGPVKDRGSNVSTLVAGAGFEPATSGL